MNLIGNIIINIYSIAVLLIVYIQYVKKQEKEFLQYKIFLMMLKTTVFLLIVDIFSRFDGSPNTIYVYINRICNFAAFSLNLVLPSLWILYVHDQVVQEEKFTRRLIFSLIFLNLINFISVIFSQFYEWFYYIDDENMYHRLPLFFVPVVLVIMFMAVGIMMLIKNRKKIEKKNFASLIFFGVPPFVGVLLQATFYGYSLMLNCLALSMLIVFVNIQNHNMYTDYLTGVNNRKKLDLYLRDKINASIENKTFSAIMIDVNDFKAINDTFGHNIGDDALKICAKLLASCVEEDDFIARFGGDEFCIILYTSDENILEETVCRIKNYFDKFNQSGKHPYKLEISIGYALYDYNSFMKVEDFQKKLDVLMYKNKELVKKM
ncbi:GGDEF domain-containing protein [[Clostridium] fimetarium]|uniref:Diguanylate cyclase (GGDEF) domain-containing protein n=1 Tax=[Clostridium] fimetarium TaxID=99656 RepID=A0A1I0R5J5_9FIRM|nr:GGDEF domain-containing protein [[Clostridium] fimetarium]SEW35789.1 diguanylate cyclase (GGDEF) domain-containing protein [[Clostridium] fimetarium]